MPEKSLRSFWYRLLANSLRPLSVTNSLSLCGLFLLRQDVHKYCFDYALSFSSTLSVFRADVCGCHSVLVFVNFVSIFSKAYIWSRCVLIQTRMYATACTQTAHTSFMLHTQYTIIIIFNLSVSPFLKHLELLACVWLHAYTQILLACMHSWPWLRLSLCTSPPPFPFCWM